MIHCYATGSTINEQRRFQHILHAADLIDAWRRLHPHTCTNTNSADNGNVNINEPVFTWRGASGPRYFGKGMRIDYHLVSGCLLREGLIERADVNGWGTDLQGFMVGNMVLLGMMRDRCLYVNVSSVLVCFIHMPFFVHIVSHSRYAFSMFVMCPVVSPSHCGREVIIVP